MLCAYFMGYTAFIHKHPTAIYTVKSSPEYTQTLQGKDARLYPYVSIGFPHKAYSRGYNILTSPWTKALICTCVVVINVGMMASSNGNIFRVTGPLCGEEITGEFPSQRPVTRNFDVCFDLRLNKRLRKQSWGWWFETPSRPLWRHSNGFAGIRTTQWSWCDSFHV